MYRTARKASQDWSEGSEVRVGFLTLRVVRRVPTPGDGRPDYYELVGANGAQYEFTPHCGLVRVCRGEVPFHGVSAHPFPSHTHYGCDDDTDESCDDCERAYGPHYGHCRCHD